MKIPIVSNFIPDRIQTTKALFKHEKRRMCYVWLLQIRTFGKFISWIKHDDITNRACHKEELRRALCDTPDIYGRLQTLLNYDNIFVSTFCIQNVFMYIWRQNKLRNNSTGDIANLSNKLRRKMRPYRRASCEFSILQTIFWACRNEFITIFAGSVDFLAIA